MSQPLHLIKLSVGPERLSDLADWQTRRLRDLKRAGKTPELMHITRTMPKQAGAILRGGSIYWVIKGMILARQKLLELRPILVDQVPHCALALDPELVRVVPRPHRPFQGWRYLKAEDTPRDLAGVDLEYEVPEEMFRELTELGLI